MPNLDVYFASDPSFKAKPHRLIERLTSRYRHFMGYERAVFGADSYTHILTIAPTQQAEYQQAWATDDNRFTLLPPGISRAALPGPSVDSDRARVRAEFDVAEDGFLLLMIGSGFRTKGLDRALLAMDALPKHLRDKTRLVVIGQDKPDRFNQKIMQMGLSDHVRILPGRSDIAAVMQAGDCLLHPAYREVAGKVILEAVVGGLPILVSDVCGYAHHVEQAQAGYVMSSPFIQQQFNDRLQTVLERSDLRQQWRENGLRYGSENNLYDMANAAASEIQLRCSNKPAGLSS
jgi:UDP-glucose:(heptosyl)LPS alpha-1,3-glucosyltransferase